MSSQAVRNNLNTSIRRVITDVKRRAIAEGKKKVLELKDQLLSPETIIKILAADINQDDIVNVLDIVALINLILQ